MPVQGGTKQLILDYSTHPRPTQLEGGTNPVSLDHKIKQRPIPVEEGNNNPILEDTCSKDPPPAKSRRKVIIHSPTVHITNEIVIMLHYNAAYIIFCHLLQQPNPKQTVQVQIDEVPLEIWDQDIKEDLTIISEVPL